MSVCLLVTFALMISEFRIWAIFPGALSLVFGFFFRDPERSVPRGANLLVAPADGRIVGIDSEAETDLLPGHLKRVSIFMSPLNVHVNRSPVAGRVLQIEHKSGRFLPAFRPEATRENERNAILVEDEQGRRILFVQVAGALARRIICRVKKDDRIQRGERVGMIVLGSRLDLYVSESVQLNVSLGQGVRAGETVVGSYS